MSVRGRRSRRDVRSACSSLHPVGLPRITAQSSRDSARQPRPAVGRRPTRDDPRELGRQTLLNQPRHHRPHHPGGRYGLGTRCPKRAAMRRRRPQLELPRVAGWGGKRRGAGRKLAAEWPSPPHRPRPRHAARWPVHVTLRARKAIPSFRSERVFPYLRDSLAASHKAAFRVVHFSVQSDHLHLVVEADDRTALVRGVQGLAVRCAKAVNRAAGRRGSVWTSRYHARALHNPTETRRGLVYALLNHRKHLRATPGIDPRSSGPWFLGWRAPAPPPSAASPVLEPRTWLASVGWLRAGGPIGINEHPSDARAPPSRRVTRPDRARRASGPRSRARRASA
jgi:REP element-mobilizing transposase RayT